MCTNGQSRASSTPLSATGSRWEQMVSVVALVVAQAGCQGHFDQDAKYDAGDAAIPDASFFSGLGLDQPCEDDKGCRSGLTCQQSQCKAKGDRGEDDRCLLTVECAEGLQCGWSGFCVPVGEGAENEECSSSSECTRDLYCRLSGGLAGHCATIADNPGDLGEACEDTSECMSGLVCSPLRKECAPGSVLLNPDLFRGVICPEAEEAEMSFGVRMSLPTDDPLPGFYATPFPTDLRIRDGKVDISSHPVPGGALIGSDPVETVVAAINDEMKGFSVNPAIYFRLTRAVDESSLRADGDDATIRLVNLDDGTPHPVYFQFVGERNKYICHNHLYVHPLWAKPLKPNTTYAAIVTSGVRSEGDNEAPKQLDALAMLLGSSRPSDGAERKAWQTFAKLRDWLDGADLSAQNIAGATVFTTGDPWVAMGTAREAARSGDAPRLIDTPVVCEEGTQSPCATPDYEPPEASPNLRDPRDCPESPADNHHEIHAKIRLPVFQDGERPYIDDDDGGGALHFKDGKPVIQGYEDVCMAITVPKTADPAEVPESGWPVVIYAHGTGGSLRTGPAAFGTTVSNLVISDERMARMAQISIDQPMHGPRQGPAQNLDPGPLFFNVRNPQAAKGNIFQGASDNFSLVRFLQDFDGELPGAGRVTFDSDRIFYHGHSQGGTTGPIFAPYEPDIRGVVFSGCAGALVFGLLGKEKPYDSSVGLRMALQELNIDEFHPLLHLFQFYFDQADPLIYAHLLYKEPVEAPKHALHVFGRNDSYTPDSGQAAYAAATGGTMALPDPVPSWFDRLEIYEMSTAALPLSGNFDADGTEITGVTVQHLNDPENSVSEKPYDGHFVTYQDKTAIGQVREFLGTLALDPVPTVR